MQSEASVIVEEIYSHSNEINKLLAEDKENEAVKQLVEKLNLLWEELDSVVKQGSITVS